MHHFSLSWIVSRRAFLYSAAAVYSEQATSTAKSLSIIGVTMQTKQRTTHMTIAAGLALTTLLLSIWFAAPAYTEIGMRSAYANHELEMRTGTVGGVVYCSSTTPSKLITKQQLLFVFADGTRRHTPVNDVIIEPIKLGSVAQVGFWDGSIVSVNGTYVADQWHGLFFLFLLLPVALVALIIQLVTLGTKRKETLPKPAGFIMAAGLVALISGLVSFVFECSWWPIIVLSSSVALPLCAYTVAKRLTV